MSRVPKCSSSLVPECPSALRVPKYPSAWVSKCTSALSACVLLVCPWNAFGVPIFFSLWVPQCPSALRMPLECFWSSQFPFECSTSKKKPATLQQNLAKNFSEYKFYMTLLAVSFLGNKICKFCLVLPATCNHSKGFQKLSLNILQSFKKLNIMVSEALFLVKLSY